MASNPSDEQGAQVPLTVLVEKSKNKVLYAECGKDFVDVLFSFLTLPLGTIARLVATDSNIKAVKFGSISSLYQSVENLDQQYLWNHTCKEMLLQPRNSMEAYFEKMKLNIDETESLPFFICEDDNCKRENGYYVKNGFVKETSTFIISDDLCVMPNLLGTSLDLLQKLEIKDINAIHKQTVIDILKLSLLSKTPLTDFIFKRDQWIGNLVPKTFMDCLIGNVEESSDESKRIVVRVLRRKSNRKILFVEAQEDFTDIVLSFLTFPLGGVLHMLNGRSSISCIDNLYKSVIELSPDMIFRSQDVKDTLSKPYIGLQFDLRNQILPICSMTTADDILKFVDPKSPISGGFTKGPISFMVTDNLVVSPMSFISGIAYLEKMKVPLNDVDERVISIGVKEGLSILKASLISTSALTNSLNLCIIHQMLREADKL
ncbi:hypothetical protein P8452_64837 [Trifolium repens]|nr:hypothetical protein P8452_64837 [Trifolium repens]